MTADARRELPPIPDDIKSIHVIGICGTGMGSLAGMLVDKGFEVRGSDKGAYPPMSTWLEARGIPIMTGYTAEHLDWNPDLVVVGNICRRDNPEAVATRERGLPALSFPEVLRTFFLKGKRPLVVTGTHGKTTTSSILAWLLEHGGHDPSFMVGGITENFGGNFKLGDGPAFIVEGDEYDTAYFDKVPKYWHYEPYRATINNIEFDHGDIYPDIDSIQHVFNRFSALVHDDGGLWVNGDDDRAGAAGANANRPVRTFGFSEACDLRATNVSQGPAGTTFDVAMRGDFLVKIVSPMGGSHNVRNVLGAMALAMDEGMTPAACAAALLEFKSVKKRQEVIGEVDGVLIYDDFAHHPTAVRETVAAIRARHPDARLWGVFEAKSNTSRMSIFQADYPDAFTGCDCVVLSAPWKKDSHLSTAEKIDLPAVVAELRSRGTKAKFLDNVDAIVEFVAEHSEPGDVVLGMSGSSFGGFHRKLLAALEAKP